MKNENSIIKDKKISFIVTCPYCKKDCIADKSEFKDILICPNCKGRCKTRRDKNTEFEFWHLVKERKNHVRS